MLVVGSHLAILGAAGPSVLFGELDVLGTLAYHGLDSDDHAFLEEGTCANDAEIGYIGRLVHLEAYAVAAEFADNVVAVFLTVLLDGMADVANAVARLALVESDEEGFASDAHEALHLGRDLANGECIGRVADVSVEFDNTIDRHVVAILKEELVGGDAVDYYIVDRDAECRREAFEPLAKRDATIIADELFADVVEKCRGNTRADMATHLGESLANEQSCIANKFDFLFCLKLNHCRGAIVVKSGVRGYIEMEERPLMRPVLVRPS